MSAAASPAGHEWPSVDPQGRPVRFTTRDRRPEPDEFEPVLEGAAVRLEPMRESHLEALCAVGLDTRVSRLMTHPFTTRDQMADYVREAIAARAARAAIPFVTILRDSAGSATVVGSTRFMNVDPSNRRMEIGSTWIGLPWQRTRVNTEAKYLMLRHAFEHLGCLRIEFKTDSLNTRSRAALLRIGAVEEGTFRSHVITAEGRVRHSVYFSITAEEWPAARSRLEGLLRR
jgi:RimJ/RimL family protein N-acetyltransferase